MARRSSASTPGEEAFRLAQGLTAIWGMIALVTFLPLITSLVARFLGTLLLTGFLKATDLPLVLPASWTTNGMLPWFIGATVALVAVWTFAFRVVARSRASGK